MEPVASRSSSIKPPLPRRRKPALAAVANIAPYFMALHRLAQAESELGEAHAPVHPARRASAYSRSWNNAKMAHDDLAALAASTPGLRRACERELARASSLMEEAATGYHAATAEVDCAQPIDLAAARARRAMGASTPVMA